MPHLTEDIHRSQISNQQFLFSSTDLADENKKPAEPAPISIEKLLEGFPQLLIDSAFHDAAVAHVSDVKTFGALMIRLDYIHFVIHPTDVMVNLANVINEVCKNASGIWGLLDHASLGCFFPEANEEKCLSLSK